MSQPPVPTRLGAAAIGWAIVFGTGLLGIAAAILLAVLAVAAATALLWLAAAGAAVAGIALLALGGYRMVRSATGGVPLAPREDGGQE